ncbi:hypothetical protein [Bradyrhizobium sp. ORS 111]|uniref:hypothetical protein n=1 Tax=Bradyrhizobium sp. ORS 111 TaxID=1685958 RepID=UPI00388F0544
MAPRHVVATSRLLSAVSLRLAVAAVALAARAPIAHADEMDSRARPSDPHVQRTAQNPPPARVILPAPWEPAAPERSAAAPAGPTDHK